MNASAARYSWPRRAAIAVLAVLALIMAVAAGGLGYGAWVLTTSRPALTGTRPVAGLTGAVTIDRDAQGVPTILAGSREDLARALGFLHGQERFFEMDLLRRAGAGELSGLVGAVATPTDMRRRLHRFRSRANAMIAAQSPADRALLTAYAEGVNAGLDALGHAPFEYSVLRVAPAPWTPADSLLVTFAMYFDLQDSDADDQRISAAMRGLLGPAMADFLAPHFTPHDAPVDGRMQPDPPLPDALPTSLSNAAPAAIGAPKPEPGSNNFAVAGRLTSTGAAMVANDMHLSLTVPNIWYRARLKLRGASGLDLIGVTLPGEPFMVVGSNHHIAWAFTDGYIESGDAVLIETLPNDARQYRTPDGPKAIQTFHEKICPVRAPCQVLDVEETIWGPIVAHDRDGTPIAWRWVAHDPNAVMITGLMGLESAQNVREALHAAHQAGLPQQNLLVGDSDGHIAWTIIGQIPRRVNLDDQVPHSWADGSHAWDGYLTAAQIPEIVDPPSGRLWSANARVLGGAGLQKLGDGGYAEGLRAGRIRDDLNARAHFAETDLLGIQTDDHATVLRPWQALLLKAIDAHADEPAAAAMRPYVEDWGEHAVPNSIGYRLVHAYRAQSIKLLFGALMRPVTASLDVSVPIPSRSAWPVERLLTEQPPALVPPPYKSWAEVTGAVLRVIDADVSQAGGLEHFTYGAMNHVGIHHPLARAIPPLGWLTDPPDVPEAGDTMLPRVAIPGFGASERLVVSPGHEETGLFEMPVGQAGNPWAPYFGMGQSAWVNGTGEPLLPGASRWRLTLVPPG
jgi:penicillin amidase